MFSFSTEYRRRSDYEKFFSDVILEETGQEALIEYNDGADEYTVTTLVGRMQTVLDYLTLRPDCQVLDGVTVDDAEIATFRYR